VIAGKLPGHWPRERADLVEVRKDHRPHSLRRCSGPGTSRRDSEVKRTASEISTSSENSAMSSPRRNRYWAMCQRSGLFPNSNQTVSPTAAVSADAPSSNNLSAYRPSLLALAWPAIHTSDHLHWPTEPAAARFSSSVVRSPLTARLSRQSLNLGYRLLLRAPSQRGRLFSLPTNPHTDDCTE
jgi:hypothetical protein